MRKLDPSTFLTMPWKNGGGTTTQVLTVPAGADLHSFDIRISMARVDADGPFSSFEGVDRTLLVTEGAGMRLHIAGEAPRTLDPRSPPFAFGGDPVAHATLIDGRIRDLNVMSRRARVRHAAERMAVDGERRLVCSGELTVVFVLDGELLAKDGAAEAMLGRSDFLILATQESVRAVAAQPAEILVVDFFRR